MNTNYASFGQRLLALIIDTIAISVVRSVVVLPLLAAIGLNIASDIQDFDMSDTGDVLKLITTLAAAIAALSLISTIITVLYFTLMESSKYQASLGKLALGIVVVDMDGNRIDFGKALIRNVGKLVSAFILLIGYIMAAFTDKKQALHDMIASTLVVKK
jgi:uncharacterized RDD family membrane protein YckC